MRRPARTVARSEPGSRARAGRNTCWVQTLEPDAVPAAALRIPA